MNQKYKFLIFALTLIFFSIFITTNIQAGSTWDISTKTYIGEYSVSSQANYPTGIAFKTDGTKMYAISRVNKTVYQYSLSTDWNVTTASYDSKSYAVSQNSLGGNNIAFNDDGTILYSSDEISNRIYQYSLSTAWDISTASYDSKYFAFTGISGFWIAEDGSNFYKISRTDGYMNKYNLSTDWDISTASVDSNYSTGIAQTRDIALNPDQTKVFIITNDAMRQYSLSTAGDITTASYDNITFNLKNNAGNGIYFNTDGTYFYEIQEDDKKVYQYSIEVTSNVIPSQTTGTFNNDLNITLTTDQSGSIGIYYTIDGSTPDNTDTEYDTNIIISGDTELKAISYDGSDYSEIMDENYSFDIFGDPTANVNTGTYNNNQTVTLTKEGTTTGTSIYYTTDGTTPTTAKSLYSTPITISGTTTLKFIDTKAGYTDSNVITKTYTMVVNDPTASVDTGTYNNNQSVTLSDTTTTASIYYTTDGTTPDNTDNLYSSAITISGTTTLKFIGIQAGYTDSNVITKTYTLEVGGTPTANVDTGSYSTPQTVTLTKAGTTTGTTMTYTTNGSNPTIGSTTYTTPILISSTTTLKFAEFKTGYTVGTIVTKTYTITIADPTTDKDTGTYNNDFSATLSQADSQPIYYTTDGTDPDNTDTLYTAPISVNSYINLKFVAYNGSIYSNIISKTYNFTVADPTASVDSGTYNNDFTFSLSTITTGVAIHVTEDGSIPDETDPIYFSTGTINETKTLKFKGYKTGYAPSNIITKTYTMEVGGTPTANYNTDTYNNDFSVTLTKAGTTTGTTMTYTTDGSAPTIASTEYSGAIPITATTTLKFAEFKTGYTAGIIVTKTYTMVVTDPTITETTGTYNNSFTTTITNPTTTGTSIYYTIDGSTPDNTDNLYSGAITINSTQTLKAIAYKTGYTTSGVDSETYTMAVGGTPTVSSDTGTYNNDFSVTLAKAGTTTGTTLTYTTNGAAPTIVSTEYSGAIPITATTTLKFAEFKAGYTDGTIVTKTYTMAVAGTPTVSSDTGTYNNDFSVTLAKAGTTTGTTLTYTTNGANPTIASTEYSGAIPITATTTLKFAEFKTGYTAGTIVTKTYTMAVGGTPTANYNTDTYNNDFSVTLAKAGTTTGTTLTYTTNGANPTIASTEYSGAIPITATTTLKFAEFKTGYTDGTIVTKTYTMAVGGTPTASVDSGTFNNTFDVTLAKAGTTTGTTLTYTTNGTDPTIASTEYTTAISIPEGTTVVKFAEFKTGYTAGTIVTKTYEVVLYWVKLQFYDENTLAPLDASVSIVDVTNGVTYNPNASGYFEQKLEDINWDNTDINAYVFDSAAGVTTHTIRNLQFYWNNDQNYDYNFGLYPIDLGEEIEFLAKDSNGNFWTNKYVMFNEDGNVLSINKTNSTGYFTSYIKRDGDYNAMLYDNNADLGDTYIKTTVHSLKPKNEKSLVDISPYDIEVGGNLMYSITNSTNAEETISIFGGTTSTYDFTIVDYNADPVDRVYIPRTYNIKNPWGLGYNPVYNLQPYLITKEDGVIPSIVVYDELKRPYPGITVSIFKQIEGNMKLVEQKVTDSTGRSSFSGFPLDTYYIYLYEEGVLRGSYNIQVRDTGETFYFVLDRTVTVDVNYRGLDLKYNWNNTPVYVNLSADDVDLNLSVYGYYAADFNISSYSLKTYQDSALIDTQVGVLSGTSVTITKTFAKEGYTVSKPIMIVADVNFTYNGQVKTLTVRNTIATGTSSSGLITLLKNFPEKVGRIWTILFSILATISAMVLVGTSDFVQKDYLVYLGLFILGIFVFIGWFSAGKSVLGIDVMWFIYIVTVVASVGFAVQDNQR